MATASGFMINTVMKGRKKDVFNKIRSHAMLFSER